MFKTEANKVVYYENGMALAYVSYPFISENTVDINHTIVDSKLQGKGIASQLLEYAYNDIKEKNLKAELSCSYAIKWFNKHPEYDDILFDGIRKYQDRDFNALYNITKGYWADEVPMSLELTDFIYDFLIKYYLYNNEYCYVGLSKGQVGAFLLSNTRNEVNESERYFKENIHKLSESEQKKTVFEGDSPYVIQTMEPQIEGIVVVAEGADSAEKVSEIHSAVRALFQLPGHKIQVLKKKTG